MPKNDQEKLQILLNDIKAYINRYIANGLLINKVESVLSNYGEKISLQDIWMELEDKVFTVGTYEVPKLKEVGLTGMQLDFKIQLFKFLESKRKYKEICDYIITILSSLSFADLIAEGLKELVELICNVRPILEE